MSEKKGGKKCGNEAPAGRSASESVSLTLAEKTPETVHSSCVSAWRRRWLQYTRLELARVLRPQAGKSASNCVQEVVETVVKTYPNCTLRTPAAPFLPSLAAPSAVLSAPRRTCLCLALVSRPAHDPRPWDQAVLRPCMSHRVGCSHSAPFPSFPTWPHCDYFFVQVKWS